MTKRLAPPIVDRSAKVLPRTDDRSAETSGFVELLTRARTGDKSAEGQLFKSCRDYLLLIANHDIDTRLGAKIAPSDIVQNTLLQATEHFDQFSGSTQESLRGWMRAILKNELVSRRRFFLDAEKRSSNREYEFESAPGGGNETLLTDPYPTPHTGAVLNEEAGQLRRALLRVSPEYRDVLLLRNWERLPFSEIAFRMDRTENAVKKLWARALLCLKKELEA